MGIIEVRNYTSAAEMIASYGAIRKRMLNPPVAKIIPPCPYLEFIPVEYELTEPRPELQHDAHVNARACHILKTLGGRVMAIPLIKEMCNFYGVTYHDICSDRRTRAIVLPRQKMMWVVKRKTKFSFPEIGRKFGDRDHTTVLHAVRKIDQLRKEGDPSVAELDLWIVGDNAAHERLLIDEGQP